MDNHLLKTYRKNFIRCGMSGLLLEIIFTGLIAAKRRESGGGLKGSTSIIMFPIYGSACVLAPISKHLRSHSLLTRGIIYTAGIFTVEYLSGSYLKAHHKCPWDYSRSRYNINGVIRIDYAPYWFMTGLLFERMIKGQQDVSLSKKS